MGRLILLFRIPVAWDGLALVRCGGESFICEPLPGECGGAFFTGNGTLSRKLIE